MSDHDDQEDSYTLYRVRLQKGSPAEQALIRDAHTAGYHFPATLIGKIVEHFYKQREHLPPPKTAADIWSIGGVPPLQKEATTAASPPPPEEEEPPWEEQFTRQAGDYSGNIGAFLE